MNYKSLDEIERLSPDELIAEKRKLVKRQKYLTNEVSEWVSYCRQIMIELNARMSALEIELYLAEEDRMFGAPQDYDHSCRIH